MKPQLLKVSNGPAHSFSVRRDTLPHTNGRWHYHVEIELIYFKKGRGTQFVGDNVTSFKEGDVVLIGSNLPHYWQFEDAYFEEGNLNTIDVIVAHFSENFWGESFLQLPENKRIKYILERASRGLMLTDKSNEEISELLNTLLHAEGSSRIILLMKALESIATSNKLVELSSIGFSQTCMESENDRINDIYEYSMANFREKIQLEEIAEIARISPHSFCRYFKSRTRKTYSQFLNEIRVGHACKLLIENRMSIKQLCYESGFNNFASFHKCFKQITGKSPLNYQREFVKN